MRVSVIGSGYVGLVTGACLAETGNSVTCMDTDVARVASLRDGRLPFHEPGLAPLVQKNLAAGRLVFTTDVGTAVRDARIIFSPSARRPDRTAKRTCPPSRRRRARSARTSTARRSS